MNYFLYLCKRNKKLIKFTKKMEWIKLTKDNVDVVISLPPHRVAIAWIDGFGSMNTCMSTDIFMEVFFTSIKEANEYYYYILPELNV